MKLTRLSLFTSALFVGSTMTFSANATIVQFKTSMGDFEVNLFDTHTPETVENFLKYVTAESYNESFIHRNAKDFVVQGGGFTFNAELDDDGEMIGIEEVEDFGNVDNEPKFSNIEGTISMAKIGGDADSATNQWFFNVDNNATNLDNQNGGFTAFGTVTAQGMEIVKAINELDNANFGGVFTDTPLQHKPAEGEFVTNEHLVMIESITVVDSTLDTNPELPPLSTAGSDDGGSNGGGGGSLNFMLLLALAGATTRRLLKR